MYVLFVTNPAVAAKSNKSLLLMPVSRQKQFWVFMYRVTVVKC